MNEMFNIKRTAIILSLNCNLNCKLCIAYSPYYKKKADLPVSTQMEYIKKYFEIVDHVELFTISGGEPLIYKNLPEFLDRLFEYSDRFDKLEIITNGTVIPNSNILNSFKQYGSKMYRFLLDDYNVSSKIPEICSRLEESNIPYMVRNYCTENSHCGGWVDLGKIDSVIHSESEAEQLFKKCAHAQKLRYSFCIYKGRFTPCSSVRHRLNLNHDVSSKDYIDLLDDTLSVEEQRNKIIKMYAINYFETCKYCKGICDDSPRFKPAEQLTKEELASLEKERLCENTQSQ